MRDPNRIDKVLERVKVVWQKCPDMRLTQLLLNMGDGPAMYYLEDDALADALERYYEVKKDV